MLDNQNEKKIIIEFHFRRNIFSKTMCFNEKYSTSLLPWQHNFCVILILFVNLCSIFGNCETTNGYAFQLHSSQIAAMKLVKNNFTIQHVAYYCCHSNHYSWIFKLIFVVFEDVPC